MKRMQARWFQTFQKRQPCGDSGRSTTQGSGVGAKKAKQRGLLGQVRAGKICYRLLQLRTHVIIYLSKLMEQQCKLWTSGGYDVLIDLSVLPSIQLQWGNIDSSGGYACVRTGIYGKTLNSSHFCYDIKTLQKLSNKRKRKENDEPKVSE